MAVYPINIKYLAEKHSQIALIDLSWVLHRSMHVFRNFTVSPVEGTNIPTGHIYGSLLAVQSFLSQPNMGVVIVRDGHPVERIAQSQEAGVAYKADRPELEYDFYQDVPKIVNLASAHPNVYYAYNSDKESDDVMYCIAKNLDRLGMGTKVWIHSGDNDLLQTINKEGTIKVCRSFDKGRLVPIGYDEVVNLEQFTKKFNGVGPDKLPIFRAVAGDSSDNIKGVPRFPRALLKEIVEQSNTIEDIFNVESIKYPNQIQKLRENKEKILTNYKLMKLQDDFEPKLVKCRVPKDWIVAQLKYFNLRRWSNFLTGRQNGGV